jgi:regulator of replication initiation timing
MSVTVWVRDDHDIEDRLHDYAVELARHRKTINTVIGERDSLRAENSRLREALGGLVDENRGMMSMPDPLFCAPGEPTNAKRHRWQSALAKAKEVLG